MDPEGLRLRALKTARGRRRVSILILFTAAARVAATPIAVAATSFDYVYVEPNTGGSSGGHAALCLRDACYHFQQADDGTIRLHRDDPARFDFDYRVLGNRSIHASRIAVAPETETRLRDAFDELLLVQSHHVETLDELTRDRRLLERLLGRSVEKEHTFLRVPASGYFVRDEVDLSGVWWSADASPSSTLTELRRRVLAVHGADFLDRRSEELRAAIASLTPTRDGAPPQLPADGVLRSHPPGFAVRYEEFVTGLLAIEVLRAAPGLRPGSVWLSDDPELRLTPAEGEKLKAFRSRLEARLVRLVASRRPDWGYPLLVGMARMAALDASLASGKLVVLDAFAEDAPSIAADTVAAHAETLSLVAEDRRADVERLRRIFFDAGESHEASFSMLELAANLRLETKRALEHGTSMRLPPQRPLPERGARRFDWPVPVLDETVLESSLHAARQRETIYRAGLGRLYHYDLLRRNCVTEIFRIVERALVQPEGDERDREAVRAASTEQLGGYVDWRRGLDFIPAVSARAVRGTYRIVAAEERPSHRRLALERMYARENRLRVDLRESNVLTARSYERNRRDSLFLFFTDDVLLRRPLYGIANVAVGLGGALAGAAVLPFDHGEMLRAGLNGTLFSLPDLALVNVRKGSFVFAPRRWAGAEEED